MPVGPDFDLRRDSKGEIVRAEKRTPDGVHRLTLKKGVANARSFSETRFYKDDRQYLVLRSTMSVKDELATLSAKADGKAFELRCDFSRYDGTHLVFLDGSSDGAGIDGTYDPRTQQFRGSITSINAWMPSGLDRSLTVFTPVFDEMAAHYDARRAPHEATIQRIIHNSMWKSVARAACWGFGALGAAAVCAGTVGVGCAAGAFGFGAAASACSDMV